MKKSIVSFCFAAALCVCFGCISAFAVEAATELRVYDTDEEYSAADDNEPESFIESIRAASLGVSYAALPDSYDSRENGLDIPVRDQGESSSCWAFSACAAAESWAVLNGFEAEESVNFSEAQLAWFGGRPNSGENSDGINLNEPLKEGGSWTIAAAVLSNRSGIEDEAYAPFPQSIYGYELSDNMRYSSKYCLKNMELYNIADTMEIKSAIMEHGGVEVSYYADLDDKYYSDDRDAYYFDGSAESNHSVFIIGWDDDYSRENFGEVKPSSNGAWLARGSWGSGIGDNGCYWISYEENELKDFVSFDFYRSDELDNNYTYNSDGMKSYITLDTTYQANVFRAEGNETIKAVSFYTYQASGSEKISYTVEIYKGVKWGEDPVNGSPAASASGTIYTNGYHTVYLDKFPTVTEGEVFSVVLKLYGAGGYAAAIMEGGSVSMHCNEGESYFSVNGEEWYSNLQLPGNGEYFSANNNCINVYTTDNSPVDKSFLEYLTEKCSTDHMMQTLVDEARAVLADENASKADVFRAQAHILSVREELNYFEVRFTDINGELIESQKVKYGSAAQAPQAPTVEDKAFVGWSEDFSKIKGDMTVQAVYKTSIPISKASVTGIVSKTYTGSALTQNIKVEYQGKTLVLGKDYTAAYQNNKNAGTAKLIIYGMGDFSGSVTKSFTILPISSSKLTVVFSSVDRIYTGSDIKPSVSVKYGSKTLVNNTDYTVSYSGCKNIGKAGVIITFKGNYTGTVNRYFRIIPKTVPAKTAFTCTTNAVRINWYKVLDCTGYRIYRWNGKSWVTVKTISGKSTVTFREDGLASGKEYKYKVKAYKVVNGVTYWGNASQTITTATRPSAASITKSYRSSNAVRIYWKKTECTGYQVYRYSSAQKKYVKVAVVSNSSPLTLRQGGLKSNTVYKYKVRAYKKTSSGKYIFGSFSSVVSVRTT